MPETIWRNGHGFEADLYATRLRGTPIIVCKKCGTQADHPMATRPCIGHSVHIPISGSGLFFDVEFRPKGRKAIRETIWLDIDALGSLLDLARQLPPDSRGHAYWHWVNADRPFPCETCHGALGEPARALAVAQRDAIDTTHREATPELGSGEV